MATTTATTISRGANDDRVIATAKQIVQSLNTTNREDMLLIFSSFDNRLSNITDLVRKEDSSALHLLKSAEGVIFGSDSDSFFNTEYLSAVDEILELLDNNLTLRSGSEIVDRAEAAVQVAMSRLEDEFRHILVRNTVPLDAERLYGSIRRLNSCFVANESEIDEFESFEEVDNENESGRAGFHERGRSLGDDCCVELIRFDAVSDLKEIADRMIRAGYEKECVQVYSNVRRDVLDECLVILGVEKLSIEEVQKIEWRALDEKMKKWIQATKVGVKVLLSGEKSLCDQIFSGSDSAKEVCFNETVKGCLMQLLNFGEAVSIAKRSSEKLFRILDMYDVLSEVMPHLKAMVTDEFVLSEAIGVLAGLGEAAKDTFAEFEIAVRRENSKKPMIGGEIHPLTRYVMNYVKLVVDYSETLNSLLKDDEDNEAPGLQSGDVENLEEAEATPITRRLLALLATLEANLKQKSKLYEDGGMQYVFLMNNILYMVQKVKSSDLIKVLGDQWARRRRGQIRQHATAYLRASWSKALSCLKDEGIGGSSSNSHKVALKDRFKNFNAQFEEIYRAQTGWKVPDPQLRDELRISISEKVLPAYRSFFGRFGSQLEYGRNAGKYVKYTADDLENYLVDLFEGVPIVLHHLRRKSV